MKKIIAGSMLAMIAGCTTPADLRKQKPTLELTSGNTSKQVAICIADHWENTTAVGALSSSPVNMRITTEGYSVIVYGTPSMFGGAAPVSIADITDKPAGSFIFYYRSPVLGFGRFEDVVKKCQ